MTPMADDFRWRLTAEDVRAMLLTAEDVQAMLITPEDIEAMRYGPIDIRRAAAGPSGRVQRIARALLAGRLEEAAALSFGPSYPRRPPPDEDDLA
jgi:hypothetical protein